MFFTDYFNFKKTIIIFPETKDFTFLSWNFLQLMYSVVLYICLGICCFIISFALLSRLLFKDTFLIEIYFISNKIKST